MIKEVIRVIKRGCPCQVLILGGKKSFTTGYYFGCFDTLCVREREREINFICTGLIMLVSSWKGN